MPKPRTDLETIQEVLALVEKELHERYDEMTEEEKKLIDDIREIILRDESC